MEEQAPPDQPTEPTTPTDASAAPDVPAATVTYKDLKRQRREVAVDALIFYQNDWYNQDAFRDAYGGGNWTYVAADVSIYDPGTHQYTPVKPTIDGDGKGDAKANA